MSFCLTNHLHFFIYCFISACQKLNALLNVPNKSTQTEQWVFNVNLMQTVQQRLYALVLTNGNDRLVHCRPCMRAKVWLACLCAAASYLRQKRVTTAE